MTQRPTRSTALRLAFGLALGLAGCAKAPQPVELPPPKVTVAHPVVRELTDFEEYNGRTAASGSVEVRSRVRGHIMKVDFQDGDVVAREQPLFTLDPQPFEAEIGRAKGDVAVAMANVEKAVNEQQRMKMLFDKEVATTQQLEAAVAERKSWEAKLAAANDEVKRRELDAQYAQIKSPIAGKVGRAMLTVGNLVNAGGGDPLLTTIVSLDPIDVYFNVDERSLIRYRERRKAEGAGLKPLEEAQIPFEFGLDTDDDFPHKGVLDFADNRIDATTGTIEIRGKAANADGRFIPGGRVRVRVAVSEPYQATLVPEVSVLTDLDQKYVLGLNAEKVVVRRNVKLGRLLPDGMRVVLPAAGEPLRTDEWVVVNGLQRARVNYPVDPRNDDGEAIASSK